MEYGLVDPVLTVTGGNEKLDFELVHEHIYQPEASNYAGEADVCIMEFTSIPEEIPGLDTVVRKISEVMAQKIEDETEEGHLLRLRIYRAKAEWYNSRWRVEVTIHASPFPWARDGMRGPGR